MNKNKRTEKFPIEVMEAAIDFKSLLNETQFLANFGRFNDILIYFWNINRNFN